MPSLRELQLDFAAAIVDQDASRMREHVQTGGAPVDERLDVYFHNMYYNLREVLREVFPVIERLVGERFFDYAADRYISEHPSTSGDVHRFGATFATFLAGFAPAASLPYLFDTAKLEWAMHEVFHAADCPPLAISRLARIVQTDCTTLRFMLNPACRLLASRFPVSRIWCVNQPMATGSESLNADSGGEFLLIRRRNFAVEARPLEPAAFTMLQTLHAGATVEKAYDDALLVDSGFQLGAFIQQHILEATIVDFDAGNASS
ncbi:DNA-binding domain-containing protein [Paraburkholderia sp. 40]|uniref:HvfC/BufC N-terminal domain-containing protein n=1 Tax=Paraburkholderia sp. 40 TaxID=2991059 RepID=UPI003D1E3D38